MTKKILLSTVVAAALATSALADNTFGGVTGSVLKGTGLNNYHTDDLFNIYANPANLLNHKDVGIMEIAPTVTINNYDTASEVIGTTIDMGGAGVLGLFVGRTDTSGIENVSGMNAVRMTDIFYATDLAGMGLGVRFSIGKSSFPDEDVAYNGTYVDATTYTQTTAIDTVKTDALSLDVGLKVNKSLKVGVAVDMSSAEGRTPGANSIEEANAGGTITTTTITDVTERSGISILANAQYEMKLGKTDTLLTAYFKTHNAGNVRTNGTETETTVTNSGIFTTDNVDTTTTLGLDAALKFQNTADAKVTMVTGIQVITQKTSDMTTGVGITDDVETYNGGIAGTYGEATRSTIMIPLQIAVEKKVSDKWTWRAGASGNIYGGQSLTTTNTTYIDNAAATDTEVSFSETQTQRFDMGLAAAATTGFSYNIAKGFDLHAVVATDFWIAGPNLLSGQANNLMAAGALTYDF